MFFLLQFLRLTILYLGITDCDQKSATILGKKFFPVYERKGHGKCMNSSRRELGFVGQGPTVRLRLSDRRFFEILENCYPE
ncbi:hypothetical protein Pan258_20700 [Symmachiella dynata]|nr:hypothetical protein Pan258_20700 [Symmachiella dynata]